MADAWFRFYNSAVSDPKVQRLPPILFRFWVNILCLASANGGALPSHVDMEFSLRLSPKNLVDLLEKLISAGLVDQTGETFHPHNWNVRQFKSDGSTERVKRFRERSKNVSETANETGPETEQRQSRAEQKVIRLTPAAKPFLLPDFIPGPAWDDFMEMRRKNRKPATEKAKALLARSLEKLMIEGQDPAEILNQSTLNGWTDVYPLKEKGKPNGRKPTSHDKFFAAAYEVGGGTSHED